MKIQPHEITIREIAAGYQNDEEEGVIGFGGKLNIRPKYQREFVYKEKQRDAVINTITKNFPLNVMYWVKNDDETYRVLDLPIVDEKSTQNNVTQNDAKEFEVLDGQQRTISICEYVVGNFSIDGKAFHNLTDFEKKQILDYKLMIYFCEGNDKEKLDWFETINVAGVPLSKQELRNAIYTGPWLSDAKRYFSKRDCLAYNIGNKYLDGTPIRQDYLQAVIRWISNDNSLEYMSKNQLKTDAQELKIYFENVIDWTKTTFPKFRREMNGLEWGLFYNQFKDQKFNVEELEAKVSELMQDSDIGSKRGIYNYVLTGKEKYLNLRAFNDVEKRQIYEKQKEICAKCKKHFEIEEMEADHITPWHEGGKTTAENCQMLCKEDNRRKSGK